MFFERQPTNFNTYSEFQLVVMIGIRKCLDWVFTQRELKILDDTLPEFSRRKQEEDRMRQEEEDAKSICLATDGVSYKLIL